MSRKKCILIDKCKLLILSFRSGYRSVIQLHVYKRRIITQQQQQQQKGEVGDQFLLIKYRAFHIIQEQQTYQLWCNFITPREIIFSTLYLLYSTLVPKALYLFDWYRKQGPNFDGRWVRIDPWGWHIVVSNLFSSRNTRKILYDSKAIYKAAFDYEKKTLKILHKVQGRRQNTRILGFNQNLAYTRYISLLNFKQSPNLLILKYKQSFIFSWYKLILSKCEKSSIFKSVNAVIK